MNYDHPQLLDHLAAQYALGTLAPRARRRFRRHLLRSLSARDAVGAWERRLGGLAGPVPPVAPPESVWQGIAARLPGGSRREPSLRSAARSRWLAWASPLLGAALGVVACIALVVQMPERFVGLDRLAQREQTLPQSYVGLLLDSEGRPTVLASATRHGQRLSFKVLRPVELPAGKVLQLWGLPRDKDGQALPPIPLGIVPVKGAGAAVLTDTAERLLSNVAQLAVTVQDAPARSGDVPGEFILKGHCVKLW
jgi:anti-sigma-K factor RskA